MFPVRVMSSVPEIYKTPDHSPSPTPERAVYGFVVYLLTTAAFLCYILWLIIPNDTLESLGITFLPQKYWAVAVPIYVSVAFFLFVIVIYPSLGMVLYTPNLVDGDLRHVIDEYTVYNVDSFRTELPRKIVSEHIARTGDVFPTIIMSDVKKE